jgi:hypothetical protein
VQAEAMVTRFDHPTVGGYRGFTRAWSFGDEAGADPLPAPALDQHGAELRAEADRLRQDAGDD